MGKTSLSALAAAAAVLLAAPLQAAEPAPNLESEFGLFEEAKEVKREINLHNLYNGLNFTAEQMERIAGLAEEAGALREKCFGGVNYRACQIVEVYREILETVRAGNRIPGALEAMGGMMEIAEKKIRSGYFKGMADLESKVWEVLTPAQREVFRTYDPCLTPPKDLKDPVRVGQADSHEEELRILALARGLREDAFERECRSSIGAMIGALEKFLGPMDPSEREAETARMLAVCRKARALKDMDFALKADDLAAELEVGKRKDVFKHKAEEFMDMVKKFQGGLIGKTAAHFLDPLAIRILRGRIEAARSGRAGAGRDLEAEAGPEDGRCGRNPADDRPLVRKKYSFDGISGEIGVSGAEKDAFRSVLAKAKAAQLRIMQIPMADGTTPLSRFLAIQTLPPENRESAAADFHARLSDPVPGKEASYLEYILWIKIGLDKQLRKTLAPGRFEKLSALVDDFLDNIDLDGGPKPTMREMALKLGLDEAQAKIAAKAVRYAQSQAWTVLSIPDESGKKPLERILAIPPTADDEQKRKGWEDFAAALGRKIPGRETTYGAEIERIKSEADATFRKAFSPDQYSKFKTMAVDLLDIQMDE